MPVKVFTETEVIELLEQNATPPLGARNAALIVAGVGWGLTPLEVSLVSTKEIISAGGEIHATWILPPEASYSGEPRRIYTLDHLRPFFEKYIDSRLTMGWGVSENLNSYRGLAPESKFFLNDLGQPYKTTKRKGKVDSYQPRSLNEQLKRIIARTNIQGATPASYRDTFIKTMYENGCKWDDLKAVSGIRQKRTLESKVYPIERELEDVLKELFTRVKVPEYCK